MRRAVRSYGNATSARNTNADRRAGDTPPTARPWRSGLAVAGGDGQVLLALDKKTGKEKWKALSSEEAGYCPPLVLEQGGVEQLLFWYPEAVVSLNPVERGVLLVGRAEARLRHFPDGSASV